MTDTAELKALAEGRIESVLSALGVNVARCRPQGPKGRFVIESPMVKQRTPSFNIYIRGAGIGFFDHATKDGGDVFALVAAFRGWWHLADHGFLEAKRWLEDHLGVHRMSAADRERDAKNARRQRARAAASAEAERQRRIGRAQQAFFAAQPWPGTPVEAYLRNRGIDVEKLRGPRGGLRLGALRFVERERHVWEGRPDDPRNGEVSHWPAMIAACCDPATGDVRAIHRTFLTPDGRAKAPVIPARKVWPEFAGLVIPLWRGESGLSVPAACAAGLVEHVFIGEGIETVLSGILADPRPRAWAAISLGNLVNIRLPACPRAAEQSEGPAREHHLIDGVLLARENDWVKSAAVAQFAAGKAALERQGAAVAEVPAYGGNDLNDVLQGAA